MMRFSSWMALCASADPGDHAGRLCGRAAGPLAIMRPPRSPTVCSIGPHVSPEERARLAETLRSAQGATERMTACGESLIGRGRKDTHASLRRFEREKWLAQRRGLWACPRCTFTVRLPPGAPISAADRCCPTDGVELLPCDPAEWIITVRRLRHDRPGCLRPGNAPDRRGCRPRRCRGGDGCGTLTRKASRRAPPAFAVQRKPVSGDVEVALRQLRVVVAPAAGRVEIRQARARPPAPRGTRRVGTPTISLFRGAACGRRRIPRRICCLGRARLRVAMGDVVEFPRPSPSCGTQGGPAAPASRRTSTRAIAPGLSFQLSAATIYPKPLSECPAAPAWSRRIRSLAPLSGSGNDAGCPRPRPSSILSLISSHSPLRSI